mgnify:CR=1 FL=1
MSEQKKGVFARVVSFVDDNPIGAYTVGKGYQALPCQWADFAIVDDEGDEVGCHWEDDVDCVFERVEHL